jgi:hypothetical protein
MPCYERKQQQRSQQLHERLQAGKNRGYEMTLRRMLKRLRLKPGDIILIRQAYSHGDLIQRICEAGQKIGLKFDVPIVRVPYGKHAIESIPFEELERAYLIAKEAKEKKGDASI